MDSSDTPPLLVLDALVLLALTTRSVSYLFPTFIDGARNKPGACACFFAALSSLLYESLDGGAGRGGAIVADRLLGTDGASLFVTGVDSTNVGNVGAGVAFLGGKLVRGGTGGIGLLGAPRLGVLGECGATVLVGGAVSAALSVTE